MIYFLNTFYLTMRTERALKLQASKRVKVPAETIITLRAIPD